MQLDTKNITGLTNEEALKKIAEQGFNELESAKSAAGVWHFITHIFSEPMFLLLIAGAVLYFILGSKAEALMLLSFVLVMITITFYQGHKSEKAILALRNLSCPRALVIRDGVAKRIAGREVVLDDIIVVNEGDTVPADAVILSSENLMVDEAILTGESVPVRKAAQAIIPKNTQPGGDDLPFIYSSTHVVQGRAIAKVFAIGVSTEIGKIGKSLMPIQTERTNLQKETTALVRNFAIISFIFCFLITILYGLTRNSWLNGLLAGITLAMAILPEEFPVVLTIFLALGAWRLSLKKVLTRRIPSIEALGTATLLCVDKTGTITQNSMSVQQIFGGDRYYNFTEKKLTTLEQAQNQLINYAVLASQRDPFDPTEIAIKNLGEQTLNLEQIYANWQFIQQYPLSKNLLANSVVWQSLANKTYSIAAKGAPEAIFDLCHLEAKETEKLMHAVQTMAKQGLRVLGVAKADFQNKLLPNLQHDFDFTFLGLIGLADPLRNGVTDAIQKCYSAGIRVIMITGDHAATAQKIARDGGFAQYNEVITGPELSNLTPEELQERIKKTNIFARVLPEQKLKIVTALKNIGEIVVMTGDGVNDAPALKAAHIGIAMGSRGTDVAREASALVLLDDDFSSIVAAIKMGRRIFDNIRKAIVYLLAAHIPIIGMSFLPILCKWPLMLLPIHVVFLELIIDPACSVVFEAEAEEKNIMERPPRPLKEKLFQRRTVFKGIMQGTSMLAITVAVFLLARYFGYSTEEVRAMTFTTMVIANLALIFANRTRDKNWLLTILQKNLTLWWLSGGALLCLGLIMYLPFLQNIFHFAALQPVNLTICLAAGFTSILVLKILEWLY